MKQRLYSMFIAFLLLAIQPVSRVVAQEHRYRVTDYMDLPAELRVHSDSSCLMEFREEWTISAEEWSITKKVDTCVVPCANRIVDIRTSGEMVRIRDVTYEFSFLDPHETAIEAPRGKQREIFDPYIIPKVLANPAPGSGESASGIEGLRNDIVAMVNRRKQGHTAYNLSEQLLSVIFHEEWVLEPGNQKMIKNVLGFTPVIWQQRRTTEGVPVNDPDTGYPVYYTVQLDRINLRR